MNECAAVCASGCLPQFWCWRHTAWAQALSQMHGEVQVNIEYGNSQVNFIPSKKELAQSQSCGFRFPIRVTIRSV